MEPYYYSKMNKVQQTAYHAIRQGLLEISDSIQIPGMEAEELYNVFFRLRLDHPEIFWATGYKYKYYPDSPNFIFIPEYLFDKNKIKEHQKALKSRVEKLVRPVKDKSEWEKEKYVHDFICANVHYDKLKKSYSHEIIGPLGQGVGVCEGIAKSVKVLCDALGIWCMIAVCGNNPEKGIKYRHTWNIVRIGGKYYHLDATFDNTLGNDKKEIRYDYFNLDDKSIFRDHEPLIAPAPKCEDGEHFYYKEKKLSFTKTEDVYKRALQTAKKGRVFTFHWRGGYLTKAVLEELLELIFPERSISGQPDIRLVYLMNDAVESFLVFHNARMTGEYRPDYEGEISTSISFEDTEYILVVHQGDSVVTIFFEDLLTDVHLYDYGEIGHFWKKNYEYLRQLEYRLAIMRDKYDYLGEEYCTPEERKLAMLVDFPPLNYCCYPAVPEQYIVPRVEPWVPTEEAIAVMEKLAAEADDKGLLKILKNYRKHPKPYIAKKIAAMLHRNAHAKVVDLLDEKLRKTVSVYEKRSFGKEMDVRCQQLMHKVEERRQQLQKEGKASVILREEPFEIAKDSIGYQIHLMIWEKGILNRKVKIESYSLEKNKE